MSDSEANPDWRLLPQRPVQFFQLANGFDRKDLKRAYNKLLRIFKPDKFPNEFQKLRAAYEQLDLSLRYGGTSSLSDSSFTTGWTNEDTSVPSNAHPHNRTSPQFQDVESADLAPVPASALSLQEQLVNRLDTTSPIDLYQQLTQSPADSAFDFYARAILSDAMHENSELMFLKWLLTGLKQYPDDSALIGLLHAYFQSDQIADELLPEVLLTVSKVITTDRFYFFTERLFDRLCQCTTWKQFENVLEACRCNINDHHVQGRVVFSCHLLRRAVWLAPIEAAEQLLAYIEEHSEFVGASLEFDVEFNIRLLDYIRGRESFAKRGPICSMIDEALKKFCLQPGYEADLNIVSCQTHISQNADSLFAELPFSPEGETTKLDPWSWVCEEVRERLETRSTPMSRDQAYQTTFKLLQQIDAMFPSSQLQIYNIGRWSLSIIGYVLTFCVSSIVAILIATLFLNSDKIMPIIAVGLPILSILIFHIKVRPKTIDRWMNRYLHRIIYRNYRDWWRGMIARFHAATHLTYYEVSHSASNLIYANQDKLNVSTWLPQLYAVDSAMMVYAASVRFLR